MRAHTATVLQATPDTWRRLLDTNLRPSRALRALVTPATSDPVLAERILERCRVVFCAHDAPAISGPV